LKNWRLVKIATTKAQRKLFFNLRSLKQGFAGLSQSEAKRIATELGVKPEEVLEMDTRISGQDVPLLAQEDDEHGYAPIDWLADEQHEPVKRIEGKARDWLAGPVLEKALANLDERSRHIVASRWLADDNNAATLHELAATYGVSAERIRQIEVKALQKMKSSLMAVH